MSESVIAEGEVDLLGLLMRVLRGWRGIALAALVGGVLGAAITFLTPRQYAVSATFLPQASSSPVGGLAAAASTLGLGDLGGVGAWSPGVFVDVLVSRQALESIVRDTITIDGQNASVYRILGVGGRSQGDSVNRAMRKLRDKHIRVSEDRKLGVVRVSASTQWSALSTRIVSSLVDEANETASSVLRRQGSAERRFAEEQAASAREQVRGSEDELREFLLRNRRLEGSPDLVLVRERLQRELTLNTQLYLNMEQVASEARLRELRDTPTIALLQEPLPPLVPQSRRGAVKVVVGGLAAAAAAVLWLLLFPVRPSSKIR